MLSRLSGSQSARSEPFLFLIPSKVLLLALFCCRWHAINSHNKLGGAYCIYNDSFLYLHIGFNSLTASGIQNGTVLLTLPVKVSTNNQNIGVIGSGDNKALICAVGVSSNGYNIVCNGFVSAGNYIADLMFIRA